MVQANFEAGAMSFEDDDTTEAHERRITRCRSCGAKIIFLFTKTGRSAPIDADTVKPEDVELDLAHHVSHFATCPNAKQHRK